MPRYRISRYVTTDAVELEAASPELAIALAEKAGAASTTFSHTVVEEQRPAAQGYRLETTADILTQKKG